MVRKRSWPAVSQICSLTRLPSSSMVRILKSMPMVVMNDGVKESSLKRSRQQDLPTPESPMRRSLICARSVSGGIWGWAECEEAYQEVIVAGSGHRCGGGWWWWWEGGGGGQRGSRRRLCGVWSR